jgi:hypothetical protein
MRFGDARFQHKHPDARPHQVPSQPHFGWLFCDRNSVIRNLDGNEHLISSVHGPAGWQFRQSLWITVEAGASGISSGSNVAR